MINFTEEEIMENWGVDNSDTPLVSVRCIAYNHEKYIAQALDGFLSQKTTFPFEVIVHDDASTDNTAQIIREYERKYPKIIKPIYEIENQYSKHDGSFSKIINAALKGKYIAFCEGDDYWTDSLKLQKQCDFLEANTDYGMCYGKVRKYLQSKDIFSSTYWGMQINDFNDFMQKGNRVPTLTVFIRADDYEKFYDEIKPREKRWLMGDYPLWLWFFYNTRVKFFDEQFGVYRVLTDSACHTDDVEKYIRFEKSRHDIRNFYSQLYLGKPEPELNENILRVNFLIQQGKRKEAFAELKKIENKSLKQKIVRFCCSNAITFKILNKHRTKHNNNG